MRSSALALALLGGAALAEPMVGPGVGSADLFVSEGSKLYNQKQFPEAASAFLKATRASPASLQAYLQLARSYHAAKQLRRACYVYRVFLKAAPDSPDRKKAQSESDLCERQLRGARGQPPDPVPKFVETKASFFAALEERKLLGAGSASSALSALVAEGFVGPDLGEMAAKLHSASVAAADELHRRALAREPVSVEALRSGRALYALAADVGPPPPGHLAKGAFLDGVAAYATSDYQSAASLFSEAAAADPSAKEYEFHRAMALVRVGDRKGALKSLEEKLPDDPRTAVLRVSLSLGESPEAGAGELERLLFSTRFAPAR
ncbi:MAG: tetratricopeptide repeat protein [Myxococcales bacterium]|nr:tetratricopeptide repeat protein [Myxococcales bacterium]